MNFDFLNPYSSRFYTSGDDLAALRAAEKVRNSWGIGDSFDQFDARVELASRMAPNFSMTDMVIQQEFLDKSQRIGWYRWMSDVPIIKKCLTIMANECCSPNEKDQYAVLAFNRNFKNTLKPYEMTQLQDEFSYVCEKVLKSDDKTIWDLFYQWLVDGEMFWEIIPGHDPKTGRETILGINVLPPDRMYPFYERGRVIGFSENLPPDYAEAIGLKATEMNILRFKPYQIAYCNFGKFGKVKQDVKGWLEPSVRPLNQLIQMEDSLIAIRVNRATEKWVVNVNTGNYGPAKTAEALQAAKKEYNKQLKYDTASGRVLHKARTISLKEMFWFAIDSEGRQTKIESLANNTTLNGQIEDVKVFEKNVYDALEIAESRRGEGTDATYSNKHEISLQEMQMSASARRLAGRFAQNMIKKVFMQQLSLRKYAPKYMDGDNYSVQLLRNNYYEKSRLFELNASRAELMNSYANWMSTAENQSPKFADEFVMSEILQFSDDQMEINRQMLKKEAEARPGKEEEGGGEGGEGGLEF